MLPSRVADYSPGLLDELTLSGEVVWAGAGSLAGNDGWVVLAPAEIAPLVLPLPDEVDEPVALLAPRGPRLPTKRCSSASLAERAGAARARTTSSPARCGTSCGRGG